MSSSNPSAPAYAGVERRTSPRLPASVVGGPAVRLLDLSKRGVHVETSLRMRAGGTVTIRFIANGQSQTLTGAVVRNTVAVLETSGEVTYHTALAFNDELLLCGEQLDGAATHPPAAEAVDGDAPNDYTMLVFDGRTGAAAPSSC